MIKFFNSRKFNDTVVRGQNFRIGADIFQCLFHIGHIVCATRHKTTYEKAKYVYVIMIDDMSCQTDELIYGGMELSEEKAIREAEYGISSQHFQHYEIVKMSKKDYEKMYDEWLLET